MSSFCFACTFCIKTVALPRFLFLLILVFPFYSLAIICPTSISPKVCLPTSIIVIIYFLFLFYAFIITLIYQSCKTSILRASVVADGILIYEVFLKLSSVTPSTSFYYRNTKSFSSDFRVVQRLKMLEQRIFINIKKQVYPNIVRISLTLSGAPPPIFWKTKVFCSKTMEMCDAILPKNRFAPPQYLAKCPLLLIFLKSNQFLVETCENISILVY